MAERELLLVIEKGHRAQDSHLLTGRIASHVM